MTGKKEIQPYSDRILIKRIEEIRANSKLLLPETAKARQRQYNDIGEVIAIGPNVPESTKVGDIIFFSPNCAKGVPDHELLGDRYKNHVMMNEEDIVATLIDSKTGEDKDDS